MKGLDYNLEIKGEKSTYTPRAEFINPIISSKKRIFEITADNSYGKTFLLNLLAYSLEAEKLANDKILPSIKDSVTRYNDESSYNLEYNIDLELPDNQILHLRKDKISGKILNINDGPPIGYRNLHKDMAIIYDVPTNPSDRLNGVIKDLGNWNENLLHRIKKLSEYFYEITKEFDSVRNEEKINNLKAKITKCDKDIVDSKLELKKITDILDELIKINELEKSIKSLKLKNAVDKEELKLTRVFKTLKKPVKIEKKDQDVIKKLNNELSDYKKSYRKIISELISHINDDDEINNLINNESFLLKKYNRIKSQEIEDLFLGEDYIEKSNKFKTDLKHIKESLDQFILDKKNDKSYLIHNSYKQLVKLLEELMDKEIDYLFQDVTSIDANRLKSQIETLISEYKVKNYTELKSYLKSDIPLLDSLLGKYMKTNIKLVKENSKRLVDDDSSQYFKVKAELEEVRKKKRMRNSEFQIQISKCANLIGIKDLSRLDDIQKISDVIFNIKSKVNNEDLLEDIKSSIINLEKNRKVIESKTSGFEGEKRILKKSLEIEDKKKPSSYTEEQKARIELLIKMLLRITANLRSYSKLISNIERGDLKQFKHEEDVKFMDIAGKIIAHSMDNKLLRVDGEYVELESYDMVRQEFICKGMIVKKDDVSTGLASANYLKQRIDNVEGKYVVVLLDEIGNMAQTALDTVISSIKKLEEQNRLVLALFTRPNNNGIKIIEY